MQVSSGLFLWQFRKQQAWSFVGTHLFCLLVCFILFETGFTYGTLVDLELDM